MDTPENSFLESLYVTGLVNRAPAAPAPRPAAAPKVPAAPMGVVESHAVRPIDPLGRSARDRRGPVTA